jgi:hypothetical protein
MAAGGVALAWRVDGLENADRDLTPAQQVALSKAVSLFPTAKFEVFTCRGNREAHSLAVKIVEAVKEGSGAKPPFSDEIFALPLGVVLVFNPKDTNLRQQVLDAVGSRLMQARIAVVTNIAAELGKDTVRIMVGEKP